MTITPASIIQDFLEQGWKMPDLETSLIALSKNSDTAFEVCDLCLKDSVDMGVLFDAMISYVSKEDLQKLVKFAINKAYQQVKKNQEIDCNIESIIAYTAYQYPILLQDYLDDILYLKINQETYYFSQPWHHLSKEHILIYQDKFINEKDLDKKYILFTCLLASKDPSTLSWLYQTAKDQPFFQEIYGTLDMYLMAHLQNVGFTVDKNQIKNYYYPNTYHIIFDKDSTKDCVDFNRPAHPTWQIQQTDNKNIACDFGGVLCNDENLPDNPLLRFLTLQNIPKGIDITLPRLVLACHVGEMNENFDTLFYQHDDEGNPKRMGEIRSHLAIVDKPLLAQKVYLSQTSSRWQFQDWALSNDRENLNRLGGMPTWIQDAQVPICPTTGEQMQFLMQLDSNLLDVLGAELMFGSGGICYVFWSDKAKVSAFFIQCT